MIPDNPPNEMARTRAALFTTPLDQLRLRVPGSGSWTKDQLVTALLDAQLSRRVEIYCDGACKGNPGRGGWGAIVGGREIFGGEPNTTNNRMELTAAVKALECVRKPSNVVVYTDSAYVINGITKWLSGWQRRGWMSTTGTPVKNKDLWLALLRATNPHWVRWEWVRGHAGVWGNERADQLANRGVDNTARRR